MSNLLCDVIKMMENSENSLTSAFEVIVPRKFNYVYINEQSIFLRLLLKLNGRKLCH